jgi:hypothetical protein
VIPAMRRKRQMQEAIFELQAWLAAANPAAVNECRAFGCCGCGAPMADVGVPVGESYCWRCVRRRHITGYTELCSSPMAGSVPTPHPPGVPL